MNICISTCYIIVAFGNLSCFCVKVFLQFLCFISVIKSNSGIQTQPRVFNLYGHTSKKHCLRFAQRLSYLTPTHWFCTHQPYHLLGLLHCPHQQNIFYEGDQLAIKSRERVQHLNVRALENICQNLNLNKMFDTFIKVSPVNQLNWCQRITHLLHKLMTIS